MNKQKLKGNMMLLLAAVVWGLSFITQSKGVETVPPIAFNGLRCLLGALVLLPLIFVLDRRKKQKGEAPQKWDRQLWTGAVVCGLFLCLATTLQTVGMVETSPGTAGFITALYMVLVPIIGLFAGKRPRPVILLSVLVAVGGLYLMCLKPGEFVLKTGDLYVCACAFAFSGHILSIDHFSPKVDGVKLSCLQFLVCGVINMVMMLFTEIPTLSAIGGAWVSLAYMGIFSCGVAYTLQIVGQQYTDPTSASILMSLESVFATLFTLLFIAFGMDLTGGALTSREILGCILMFVAILLVQLPEKRKS